MSYRVWLCSTCKHRETKHVEARRGMPAYCMACLGARALHRWEMAS